MRVTNLLLVIRPNLTPAPGILQKPCSNIPQRIALLHGVRVGRGAEDCALIGGVCRSARGQCSRSEPHGGYARLRHRFFTLVGVGEKCFCRLAICTFAADCA